MTYKHFYRSIIIRLLLIVVLTILSTWLFIKEGLMVAGILVALVLIIAIINIIRYFNNINRWMAFFLLGIENEDTSLKIPSKTGNKAIDEVYKGMNRLNELFRMAKMEISSQEQYFRSVINQSATGLLSVNSNGRIININPAATKLTGANEFHHINSLTKIDNALPGFIMQTETNNSRTSAIFENRSGQKLLFNLSTINIKNEKIRLIAVSDITKELDSREVDAWIKLARTLSHEIMNNITPITTLSQVILQYYSKNNKKLLPREVDANTIDNTVKGLTIIQERSLGLINFVENYRKFTKLPEPHFTHVNISSLIKKEVMAATAFEGFESINTELKLPDDIAAYTDKKLLSQVVTNLLKNAVEALILNNTPKPTLWITASQYDTKTEIVFKNNGPSIPPDLREQIFVPFFTTKQEGSGIGLSLSKQMMLSMGGDIVLNHNDNGVTAFTLLLK